MCSFQTIKKGVVTSLLLMFTLVEQPVSGQKRESLTGYLSQRFQQYISLLPREEVFVSTDRDEYISGEIIWFSVWLTDRQNSCPATSSKIVYLELLNAENKAVAQKRIFIEKGSGQGQIELSDTLYSGTYTIRAYTAGMKNFLPENCFLKDISIYNAYNSLVYKNKVYAEEKQNRGTVYEPGEYQAGRLFTMQINNSRQDTLKILIHAHEKFLTGNNNVLYLFIQTHGNINHVSREKITGEQTKITISKRSLIPGINQITLFDSIGQPVCERYIYTPETRIPVLIVHSADTVGTRSKVSVELSLNSPDSNSMKPVSLSVSVIPASCKKPAMEPAVSMLFGSEFGPLPARIMEGINTGEVPRLLTDSLLLNMKSNWTDWKWILADTLPGIKFRMEKENHFLSGNLFTHDQKHAGPGEFVLLSIPGKIPVFQYAITDKNGRFSFHLPLVREIQDLIIQPDNNSENFRINFESSFSDRILPSAVKTDSMRLPVLSRIAGMGINYQVGKIYGTSYTGTSGLSSFLSGVTHRRFYGKPDSEIRMKEWVKLSSMEEVFFEIVPNVTLKKNKSGYELLLTDPFGKILYDTPPVLLIDGVIIKDPAILADLNPEHVEKIDIIKERYMVGDYLFNGIVHVITRAGNYSNVVVPEEAVRMPYRIIDPESVFVSPDYSTSEMKNNREPDFRNTLYWNASVKPDNQGKLKFEFLTSDIRAEYEIIIHGITSEGKILSARKTIRVK
jgi:hypothetical protein